MVIERRQWLIVKDILNPEEAFEDGVVNDYGAVFTKRVRVVWERRVLAQIWMQ